MCNEPELGGFIVSIPFIYIYFQPAIDWVRHNVKEIVGTVDCNLVFSLLKLLECFFTPFTPKEVRQGALTGLLL